LTESPNPVDGITLGELQNQNPLPLDCCRNSLERQLIEHLEKNKMKEFLYM